MKSYDPEMDEVITRKITVDDVAFFRKHVPIGQRMNCMVFVGTADAHGYREVPDMCRLKKKGVHTCQTTKGTMMWTLLTIWNQRLLSELREEQNNLRRWRRKL